MKMKEPFLSIIIPVYNGLTNGLPKCLDSIWEQSLDKQFYEVICIDDCSTDDTRTQYQPILFIHYNKTAVSTTMTSYKSPITVYSTLRAGHETCRIS